MEGKIIPTKVYSVKEAAEVLGIHFQTVERLCKSGRIKAQKVKGWRILGQSLIEFLQG